jgi:hypothetical protein
MVLQINYTPVFRSDDIKKVQLAKNLSLSVALILPFTLIFVGCDQDFPYDPAYSHNNKFPQQRISIL